MDETDDTQKMMAHIKESLSKNGIMGDPKSWLESTMTTLEATRDAMVAIEPYAVKTIADLDSTIEYLDALLSDLE